MYGGLQTSNTGPLQATAKAAPNYVAVEGKSGSQQEERKAHSFQQGGLSKTGRPLSKRSKGLCEEPRKHSLISPVRWLLWTASHSSSLWRCSLLPDVAIDTAQLSRAQARTIYFTADIWRSQKDCLDIAQAPGGGRTVLRVYIAYWYHREEQKLYYWKLAVLLNFEGLLFLFSRILSFLLLWSFVNTVFKLSRNCLKIIRLRTTANSLQVCVKFVLLAWLWTSLCEPQTGQNFSNEFYFVRQFVPIPSCFGCASPLEARGETVQPCPACLIKDVAYSSRSTSLYAGTENNRLCL